MVIQRQKSPLQTGVGVRCTEVRPNDVLLQSQGGAVQNWVSEV